MVFVLNVALSEPPETIIELVVILLSITLTLVTLTYVSVPKTIKLPPTVTFPDIFKFVILLFILFP